MKNKSNQSTIAYILFVLFWYFGFSAAFFVLTFMIRALLTFGFLLYEEIGLWTLVFMFLILVVFILPLFPIFLLIWFTYNRFYLLLPVSAKHKGAVKNALYFLSYILALQIFDKLAPDIDAFQNNKSIIYILSFIVILACDYFCDKIIYLIKDKFKSRNKS